MIFFFERNSKKIYSYSISFFFKKKKHILDKPASKMNLIVLTSAVSNVERSSAVVVHLDATFIGTMRVAHCLGAEIVLV